MESIESQVLIDGTVKSSDMRKMITSAKIEGIITKSQLGLMIKDGSVGVMSQYFLPAGKYYKSFNVIEDNYKNAGIRSGYYGLGNDHPGAKKYYFTRAMFRDGLEIPFSPIKPLPINNKLKPLPFPYVQLTQLPPLTQDALDAATSGASLVGWDDNFNPVAGPAIEDGPIQVGNSLSNFSFQTVSIDISLFLPNNSTMSDMTEDQQSNFLNSLGNQIQNTIQGQLPNGAGTVNVNISITTNASEQNGSNTFTPVSN